MRAKTMSHFEAHFVKRSKKFFYDSISLCDISYEGPIKAAFWMRSSRQSSPEEGSCLIVHVV